MNRIVKRVLWPLVLLRRWRHNRRNYRIGRKDPKKLAAIRFREHFQRDLNWDDPRDLNEKINWLKFYSDTSTWTLLADKFRVRKYVEEQGLAEILPKFYGRWFTAEEIEWEKLPNQFVMKMNNGSGDIFICKDKGNLDQSIAMKHFKKLLKSSFGIVTAEPHYAQIPPCIIAEELLDVTKQPIPTSSLIDYKIWCFGGKPECIWACYNRTKESVEVANYDLNWHYHPEHSVFTHHYVRAQRLLPRPQSLQRMLEIASILSKGFPEVRIDLYEVDGRPYFGEMTFSSNYGMMDFYTPEYLLYLGNKVDI